MLQQSDKRKLFLEVIIFCNRDPRILKEYIVSGFNESNCDLNFNRFVIFILTRFLQYMKIILNGHLDYSFLLIYILIHSDFSQIDMSLTYPSWCVQNSIGKKFLSSFPSQTWAVKSKAFQSVFKLQELVIWRLLRTCCLWGLRKGSKTWGRDLEISQSCATNSLCVLGQFPNLSVPPFSL